MVELQNKYELQSGSYNTGMRGLFSKLAIFLIIGALINVAVAWGHVVWIGTDIKNWIMQTQSDESLYTQSRTGRGALHISALDQESIGINLKGSVGAQIEWSALSLAHNNKSNKSRIDYPSWVISSVKDALSKSAMHAVDARGWPALSLYSIYDTPTWGSANIIATSDVNSGMMISYFRRLPNENNLSRRVLPLKPIWRGFIFNTIFYSIILWIFTLCPIQIRRIVRYRKGRCPKCGYELLANHAAGCPECGWNRS